MTGGDPESGSPGQAAATVEPRASRAARWRRLLRAVRDGDESTVENAILQLSRSRGVFAPLVLMVERDRDALPRPQAAVLELAAHARPDPAGDVDLGRDARLEGTRPARQVVPRADRPDPDPDRARDRCGHRCELLPERRVRLRDHRPHTPAGAPCVRARPQTPRAILVPGLVVGLLARTVGGGGHALGAPLVRDLDGGRRRPDDGLLRRRAREADRCQAGPHAPREAHDQRGRRCDRRDRLALPRTSSGGSRS